MIESAEILGCFIFIFTIYTLFCGVVFIVSLWKIFTKENIPGYFSIIPFLNIYKYYKICSLPFWTIFVPIINIICLYCSSYVITRKYRCKKWQSLLSIFLPFIFLPYIAFSNKRNIDFLVDDLYVKNNKDIDELENNLKKDFEFDYNIKKDINNSIENENIKETFVDSIEDNITYDEYIYDDNQSINDFGMIDNSNNTKESYDFVEINDISIDNLSLEKVDELEQKISTENSVEKKIETTIKDYEDNLPSDETIAFGGKRKIANIDAVKTKNDALKCTRCGSSLVGANEICPGCGAKI